MDPAEIASRVGITRCYLYKIFSGAKRPTLDVADPIQAASNDVILASELIRIKPVTHRVDKAKNGRK